MESVNESAPVSDGESLVHTQMPPREYSSRTAFLQSLKSPESLDELPEDSRECNICQDTYFRGERPVVLPCGHILGKLCLMLWTDPENKAGPQKGCPLCRKQFWTVKDIDPDEMENWFQGIDEADNPPVDHLLDRSRCLQAIRNSMGITAEISEFCSDLLSRAESPLNNNDTLSTQFKVRCNTSLRQLDMPTMPPSTEEQVRLIYGDARNLEHEPPEGYKGNKIMYRATMVGILKTYCSTNGMRLKLQTIFMELIIKTYTHLSEYYGWVAAATWESPSENQRKKFQLDKYAFFQLFRALVVVWKTEHRARAIGETTTDEEDFEGDGPEDDDPEEDNQDASPARDDSSSQEGVEEFYGDPDSLAHRDDGHRVRVLRPDNSFESRLTAHTLEGRLARGAILWPVSDRPAGS